MKHRLEKWIARGRSPTLEFKRSTGELREAMQKLCAFANGDGGRVIFGVRSRGEILGQQVSEFVERDRLEPLPAEGNGSASPRYRRISPAELRPFKPRPAR